MYSIPERILFAFRALKSNRLCSCISILGLGLGLACFIVIVKYVWLEYTTDTAQRNYHRIYCTVSQASEIDIPCLSEIINCSDRLADYPEVEARTRVSAFDGEQLSVENRLYKADVLFTGFGFFQVFDFPLVVGDTATALQQTTDMLLTRSFARKMFGEQDPLGKKIQFRNKDYTVTGILKDIPVNSSFRFDVLIPDRPEFSRMMSEFIVLKEKVGIQSVKEKLLPEKFYGSQHFNYDFIPFEGLYFNTGIVSDVFTLLRHGNKHSLMILWIAGWVILSISLVNYMNIYQVALLRRNRELGVKKVLGEGSPNLWLDFWLENIIMVTGGVILAVVVIGVLAGWIEQEMGLPVRMDIRFDSFLCVGILLLVPGIVSLYSLWKYRKLQPAMAVKTSGVSKSQNFTRHLLLGIQYVMTLIMLIVSFYFIRQLDFMLNKDLGINQENIVHAKLFKSLPIESLWVEDATERENRWKKEKARQDQHRERIDYVIDEIQKCPYIQQSCSGQSLLDGGSMPWKNTRGGGDYISCRLVGLTPEYLTLYGLKLKEGRFFDLEKDKDREEKVVLNETALKMFGFTSLEEAELESQYWGKGWKVIGVVEDFRVDHLAVPIAPMIMVYFDDREDCPYQMQVTKGKEKEVISLLNTLYQKTQEPGELEYYFFEDEVRALYTKDKKMAEVTIIFTLLAIFISSIGLFGFAYFDIRILEREGAEKDYTEEELQKVAELDKVITEAEKDALIDTIIVKTQGFVNGNIKEGDKNPVSIFKRLLALYKDINRDALRENMRYFLSAIMPVCEEYGVNMCVHPDDPPFQVLGLPRIVTNENDIEWFLNAVDNPHNGLTFCAGSLSAGEHNDTRELAKKFAKRTHFVHLRSTAAMQGGNFIESSHLTGRGHLVDLIRIFENENPGLPMRVDHGRMMLGDEDKGYNPGYSFHGRMLALAQVEGMMAVVDDEKRRQIIL